jgi:hypothetical protein
VFPAGGVGFWAGAAAFSPGDGAGCTGDDGALCCLALVAVTVVEADVAALRAAGGLE